MNKPKKIFVVDDDKIYHFILKTFFRKNNIDLEAHFFENGYEALQALKLGVQLGADLPDLILLDLNMPIMDGWQFLEEFKILKVSHGLEISIFVITSSNDQSDLDRAAFFTNEISKYLLKPINESLLALFA